ncbi:hypothetical protein DRQ36_00480 [bacterium]|nr:MAG: hypothetical protein DRQ36_00480 [bacterium]
MVIFIELICLGILLAMSAFFSGSETAFFSLSRFDVERMTVRKLRGGSEVARLLGDPARLLAGILVGNMVVNVAATTLTTSAFLELLGPGGVPVAVAVMTVLILIFGEITPKVIAVEHNELWARMGSRALEVVLIIASPFVWVLRVIQTFFLGPRIEDDMRLGEVDIESTLELAQQRGAIKERSKELLLHVLALDNVMAEDIMVPRSQIHFLDASTTIEEAQTKLQEIHAKYAIVKGKPGEKPKIIERDKLLFKSGTKKISEFAEKPIFAPLNRSLPNLLDDVRTTKCRQVIVVNEKGDMVGIVTRNRILEAVFGKGDTGRKADISRLSRIGGFYLLPATIQLAQFNETFGVDFKSDSSSNLGEYLIEAFGEVPSPGDSIEVEGFLFRVIYADSQKIDRVAVKELTE